jgi:hypothetical protein
LTGKAIGYVCGVVRYREDPESHQDVQNRFCWMFAATRSPVFFGCPASAMTGSLPPEVTDTFKLIVKLKKASAQALSVRANGLGVAALRIGDKEAAMDIPVSYGKKVKVENVAAGCEPLGKSVSLSFDKPTTVMF